MREITMPYPYEDDTDKEEGYPDEEMETLHFYLDQPRYWNKDRIVALLAGVLALAMIVGLCCIPDVPSYQFEAITVPARISPLEIRAAVAIVPTGKQNHPATQAQGTLTVYNGSFLAQQLPARFILTTSPGVEIETDSAVDIPAGNPPQSYGTATVPAHASAAGANGNIEAYAVNQTYGAALYIKNLSAFSGGQDAYTTTYATSQDVSAALESARQQLSVKQPIGLTTGPCSEKTNQKALQLEVVWTCQYVSYARPKGVQILSVRVAGNTVILQIKREIPARPERYS